MGAGIERLRARRGRQQVGFDQVADHLVDYVERHPEDAGAVERAAAFLAGVEGVPHDHDADDEGGGLPTPGEESGGAPAEPPR